MDSVLDSGNYPTGIKVSDKIMKTLPPTRHETHSQWTYTISPPAGTSEPSDVESR